MSRHETYLESFIDHITTLPHEIRRNLELMKDMDQSCSYVKQNMSIFIFCSFFYKLVCADDFGSQYYAFWILIKLIIYSTSYSSSFRFRQSIV